MKVRIRYPAGMDGWTKDVDMPAVPRIDDGLNLSIDDEDREYRVHAVVWYPNDPDIDAYVVVR